MTNLPQDNNQPKNQEPDDLGSGYMQKPHMQRLYRILMSLVVVAMVLMLAQAFIPVPFLAVFFNPSEFFKLPYNGIDFQKIAYIDNQFVMYGIDYDKSDLKQLVIFNSADGKKWNKSSVEIDNDNQGAPISVAGTFNYFNGKCYLIGATVQPLVAQDCNHWQTQAVNSLESNNNHYLYQAHSSAIVNNTLYVGGEKGVYKTTNGTSWSKELLPYPQESNPNHFENRFYSMAVGNNKLITETNWWQNKQRRGLIYTKDLTTNKWSYEVYPVPVGNITRGKDRFVGTGGSYAFILADNNNNWESEVFPVSDYELEHGYGGSTDMTYGINSFIGVNSFNLSYNGVRWETIKQNFSNNDIWATDVICSRLMCVGVGSNYQIIITDNGQVWQKIKFNHKNSKLHWWRRFF